MDQVSSRTFSLRETTIKRSFGARYVPNNPTKLTVSAAVIEITPEKGILFLSLSFQKKRKRFQKIICIVHEIPNKLKVVY